jgi:hypothetical protein
MIEPLFVAAQNFVAAQRGPDATCQKKMGRARSTAQV